MVDRETLDEFLNRLADKFYGFEIVEILEDNGIITVEQLLALIEDYVMEGKKHFEI